MFRRRSIDRSITRQKTFDNVNIKLRENIKIGRYKFNKYCISAYKVPNIFLMIPEIEN